MLPHRHWQHIPLKIEKHFAPSEHFSVLQKQTVAYEQKARAWETATVGDIADKTCNGPGNVSKCTEMAWLYKHRTLSQS